MRTFWGGEGRDSQSFKWPLFLAQHAAKVTWQPVPWFLWLVVSLRVAVMTFGVWFDFSGLPCCHSQPNLHFSQNTRFSTRYTNCAAVSIVDEQIQRYSQDFISIPRAIDRKFKIFWLLLKNMIFSSEKLKKCHGKKVRERTLFFQIWQCTVNFLH